VVCGGCEGAHFVRRGGSGGWVGGCGLDGLGF